MTQVTIELGPRAYPVRLEEGFARLGEAMAARVAERRAVLVTDGNVATVWADPAQSALELAGFDVSRIVLPAGESHKTVATWNRLVDDLLALRVTRKTPVVALGGGVVGDLAGFAAATVLRGLPFVQLPTTLLAMVDSSVGGKTGVNHGAGKNLVGAFHQPCLVYGAMQTLGTLPAEELGSGLGEVLKTALLGDAGLLQELERQADALRAANAQALAPVVRRCVELKAQVVAADEREAGSRAVLNLGHTVGHAIEAASDYRGLRHGEAVAVGILYEAGWAVRSGVCQEPGIIARIRAVLAALGLPDRLPPLDRGRMIAAMRLDKKSGDGKLQLPVLKDVGHPVLVPVPLDALDDLLMEPP